jgi:hypothetical protein
MNIFEQILELVYMKAKNKKKLILSLIKDDLINAKLVNGLNEIGLNADNYFLHLSDTIFKLIGFEDNEETEIIFERYLELAKRALFIDISQSHKPMDDLALQIYTELLSRKPDD